VTSSITDVDTITQYTPGRLSLSRYIEGFCVVTGSIWTSVCSKSVTCLCEGCV
jgi:hypothetical protein